jgi:hypothetical protein
MNSKLVPLLRGRRSVQAVASVTPRGLCGIETHHFARTGDGRDCLRLKSKLWMYLWLLAS